MWNSICPDTPPLGLGYLLASLKRAGFSGRVVDLAQKKDRGVRLRDVLRTMRPAVVGVQAYSNEVEAVGKTIEAVRAELGEQTTVVLGGPHVSTTREQALDHFPGADFGLCGEGEISFVRLMQSLPGGKQHADLGIPGLVYRADGGVRMNEPQFVTDLDQLAPPDWDALGVTQYDTDSFGGGYAKRSPAACMLTSRGCPFRCTFCAANPVSGRLFRVHSGARVVWEMQELIARGFREIKILDDNVAADIRHLREVHAAMKAAKLDLAVSVVCGLHLRTIDEEVIELLLAMGAYQIMVAVESGAEHVLRDMNKGIDVPLVREKVALLRKYKLPTAGYFLIGYPTETRADIERTISLALELPLVRAHFNMFSPYPGAEVYEQLRREGRLQEIELVKMHAETANYSFVEGVSVRELNAIRRRALLRFYLRPRILWGFLRSMNNKSSMKFLFRKTLQYFGLRGRSNRAKEIA